MAKWRQIGDTNYIQVQPLLVELRIGLKKINRAINMHDQEAILKTLDEMIKSIEVLQEKLDEKKE